MISWWLILEWDVKQQTRPIRLQRKNNHQHNAIAVHACIKHHNTVNNVCKSLTTFLLGIRVRKDPQYLSLLVKI